MICLKNEYQCLSPFILHETSKALRKRVKTGLTTVNCIHTTNCTVHSTLFTYKRRELPICVNGHILQTKSSDDIKHFTAFQKKKKK